jgi:hypothetical protein
MGPPRAWMSRGNSSTFQIGRELLTRAPALGTSSRLGGVGLAARMRRTIKVSKDRFFRPERGMLLSFGNALKRIGFFQGE